MAAHAGRTDIDEILAPQQTKDGGYILAKFFVKQLADKVEKQRRF
jgi:hypothetical protein